MPDTEARHPIQVVARRTGLSADVIRVWERRYRVVEPHRASNARRLYSDADVERLTLLRQATAAGRRIGDVAALSTPALKDLVAADASAAPAPVSGGLGAARDHLAGCRKAVADMDPRAFHQALTNSAVALSTPVLLEQVIGPLMRDIGDQWRDGNLRVCHEHMASPMVRAFLTSLVHTASLNASGPVLVVATPTGQMHEAGAQMAALTAATEGWEILYVAPNLPADDIAAAAVQRGARAVALSLTFPPDDHRLADELRRLRALLPDGLPIVAGGASADAYGETLDELGVARINDFGLFRRELERLRGAR